LAWGPGSAPSQPILPLFLLRRSAVFEAQESPLRSGANRVYPPVQNTFVKPRAIAAGTPEGLIVACEQHRVISRATSTVGRCSGRATHQRPVDREGALRDTHPGSSVRAQSPAYRLREVWPSQSACGAARRVTGFVSRSTASTGPIGNARRPFWLRSSPVAPLDQPGRRRAVWSDAFKADSTNRDNPRPEPAPICKPHSRSIPDRAQEVS